MCGRKGKCLTESSGATGRGNQCLYLPLCGRRGFGNFYWATKATRKGKAKQATDCKGWGCVAERGEALAVRCSSG